MTLSNSRPLPNSDLTTLITTLRQYPLHSMQYQKTLTQIIRQVTPKLWRENTPYYADALQQTWLYLCQNVHRYEANLASLATWLNVYLKWRLKDLRDRAKREEILCCPIHNDSNIGRPLIDLPDRHSSDFSSSPLTLDGVRNWVQTDASGELRRICIQGHPEINCQVLILRRLEDQGATWRNLSAEFGVAMSTLTTFYYRQCLTRLRQFGEAEGYL